MAQITTLDTMDLTTSEHIKRVAKIVFQKQGYTGTRTRDIAQEAGVNIALINYHFQSKENLFNIIMLETIVDFIKTLTDILKNKRTTLERKITLIVRNYIDFIIKEPNIPLFMLNELHHDGNNFFNKLPDLDTIMTTSFFQQYEEAVASSKLDEVHPMHFLMNILSLAIFPFVAQPLLKGIGGIHNDKAFKKLMIERKKLVPKWIINTIKK